MKSQEIEKDLLCEVRNHDDDNKNKIKKIIDTILLERIKIKEQNAEFKTNVPLPSLDAIRTLKSYHPEPPCGPALNIAIERGDIPIARMLIDAKANVNIKNTHHCTPLYLAVKVQKLDALLLLLESKADIHIKNGSFGSRQTALELAEKIGNFDFIEALKKAEKEEKSSEKCFLNYLFPPKQQKISPIKNNNHSTTAKPSSP